MRVQIGIAPLLPMRAAVSRHAVAPRMDILDELKYQLSNSDEGTRPARDLIENPVAAAYLLVLALFGAGLGYLIYSDTQAKARREAAYREQEAAAEMLRAQGLEAEAAVLDRDLKKQVKADSKPKGEPSKPKGLAADPYDMMDSGNRFERRQSRTAKREKKEKRRAGKRKGR